MRGRKPEPTADRNLPLPAPPKELDRDARKEWDRLIPILPGIDERDRGVLFVYCKAWSKILKAERALAKEKLVLRSPKGYIYPNNWFSVLNAAILILERNAAKLGLTPLSRSQIRASGSAKKKTEWDGLLAGNETVKIRNVG